jgi:hypothetical protein
MPRFRNATTGVVVEVREGKVPTGEYEPVEGEADARAGEDEGYQSFKVADLRAEIERRNEGRDEGDLLPVDGKKADLIAALEADDGK